MQVNDVAVDCDAVWLGNVRIPGENPARNVTYAHAQDFAAATSHPESIYSTTTEQTTDNRLSRVLMNSM
jgi:hypothetical protein